MNHPASFAVRLNGAKGKMDAKVHSPSGALDKCVVTELERGVFGFPEAARNRKRSHTCGTGAANEPVCCLLDKYAIRFIPRENGVHTIDVKFNGSHIPGSPFQVRVGEPGQAGEPGLVSAYGAGLERGTTGESLFGNWSPFRAEHAQCDTCTLSHDVHMQQLTAVTHSQVPSQSSSSTTPRRAPGPWL